MVVVRPAVLVGRRDREGQQDAALERYLRLDSPQLRFVTRDRATSTLCLLAALRRAELVAMQADRPSGGRGDAIVPFFGEPAAFPLGGWRVDDDTEVRNLIRTS